MLFKCKGETSLTPSVALHCSPGECVPWHCIHSITHTALQYSPLHCSPALTALHCTKFAWTLALRRTRLLHCCPLFLIPLRTIVLHSMALHWMHKTAHYKPGILKAPLLCIRNILRSMALRSMPYCRVMLLLSVRLTPPLLSTALYYTGLHGNALHGSTRHVIACKSTIFMKKCFPRHCMLLHSIATLPNA